MTLDFTGMMLDIMILAILIFSLWHGYKKGIVDRVLHFASSLLIFALSWFLSKPVAVFFSFGGIEGIDPTLLRLISPVIGRIVGFVVIFIVLSVIRSIAFMMIHSVIEGIKGHLRLVRWVDNGFGALFNAAKNTLLIYVLLVGMCMPVFENGITIINDSKLGPLIMNASPKISEQIIAFGQEIADFTHVEEWSSREFDMQDMITLLDAMNAMDVLDEEQFNQIYTTYQSQIDVIPSASVSGEEYDKLMEMIDRLPAGDPFKTVARSKIVRSE